MTRGSRRGRAAAAVVLAMLAGCAGRGPDRPALAADAAGSTSIWGYDSVPHEVLFLGTAPLRVLRPVTLESVTVEVSQGRLDLLDVRVGLFACRGCRVRPGLVGYTGFGQACSTKPWPPPDYGPTYPLTGFTVAPGDHPSIALYLRPRTPSAATTSFTVTYLDGGVERRVRFTHERVKVTPPGPEGHACPDSMWFGGSGDPGAAHVRPLSPTP